MSSESKRAARSLALALPCVAMAACGPDLPKRYVEAVGPANSVEITDYPRQDGQEVWVHLAEGRPLEELIAFDQFGPLRPGDTPEEAAAKLGPSAGFREDKGQQEHYIASPRGELAIGRVRTSGDWSAWALYLYPVETDPAAYIPEPLLRCCIDVAKTYSHVRYRGFESTATVDVQLSRGSVRRIRWVSQHGEPSVIQDLIREYEVQAEKP